GKSLAEVQQAVNRASSTLWGYLDEFIQANGISDISPWLDEATFARVREAAREVGGNRLKPIFEALGGTVEYPHIRIAMSCLANLPPEPAAE
ncbi:MAG: DNA helicase RecQ, partial [Planctomycetaceae bacterium]